MANKIMDVDTPEDRLKKADDFFGNDYARVVGTSVSWYRFRNT